MIQKKMIGIVSINLIFFQIADLQLKIQNFEDNTVDKSAVGRLESKIRDLENKLDLEISQKHRLEVSLPKRLQLIPPAYLIFAFSMSKTIYFYSLNGFFLYYSKKHQLRLSLKLLINIVQTSKCGWFC